MWSLEMEMTEKPRRNEPYCYWYPPLQMFDVRRLTPCIELQKRKCLICGVSYFGVYPGQRREASQFQNWRLILAIVPTRRKVAISNFKKNLGQFVGTRNHVLNKIAALFLKEKRGRGKGWLVRIIVTGVRLFDQKIVCMFWTIAVFNIRL